VEFAGVDEKLDRVRDSIDELDKEIATLFEDDEQAFTQEPDGTGRIAALIHHRNRQIPLRFSVLAGEIIHHLRSCFDHLVWQFSSEAYRRDYFQHIEFPVFVKKPVEKKRIFQYERKVGGVTNPNALALIESLQPYQFEEPTFSAIFIIHAMDVIDKHRELVLYHPTASLSFPSELMNQAIASVANPELETPDLYAEIPKYVYVVPQLSFKQFGPRSTQPVISGLNELTSFVDEVVEKFRQLS
jgi:hypothetical protein